MPQKVPCHNPSQLQDHICQAPVSHGSSLQPQADHPRVVTRHCSIVLLSNMATLPLSMFESFRVSGSFWVSFTSVLPAGTLTEGSLMNKVFPSKKDSCRCSSLASTNGLAPMAFRPWRRSTHSIQTLGRQWLWFQYAEASSNHITKNPALNPPEPISRSHLSL